MKNAVKQESCSGGAEMWIWRLMFFGFPCLLAYGSWELSEYLFASGTHFGRALNWIATLAVVVILLQLFNAVVIDLPRARKRERNRAQKSASAPKAR